MSAFVICWMSVPNMLFLRLYKIKICTYSYTAYLQDQFTNKNTNGTWSNILVGLPHYWNSDPYNMLQQRHPTDQRRTRGYSVHSHLFRNLEADKRYEVIVQSQNQFGWSEPTKPFIFSTRYQGTFPFFIFE